MRLGGVRKFGVMFRFIGPEAPGRIYNRCKLRIIELAQELLVLIGEPRHRHRHLDDETLQFGEDACFDLHPLPGDLDQSFGEVPVEAVLAAVRGGDASAQDAFEGFGRDKVSERLDGGWLDPALHQCSDGRMDLVAAQFQGTRSQCA